MPTPCPSDPAAVEVCRLYQQLPGGPGADYASDPRVHRIGELLFNRFADFRPREVPRWVNAYLPFARSTADRFVVFFRHSRGPGCPTVAGERKRRRQERKARAREQRQADRLAGRARAETDRAAKIAQREREREKRRERAAELAERREERAADTRELLDVTRRRVVAYLFDRGPTWGQVIADDLGLSLDRFWNAIESTGRWFHLVSGGWGLTEVGRAAAEAIAAGRESEPIKRACRRRSKAA